IRQQWQPILTLAGQAMPQSMPLLDDGDRPQVIELWAQTYQHARPQERIGLAVFSYLLNTHEYALQLLADNDYQQRIKAVRILGYMRDESVWPKISELARGDDTEISLTAFAAMTSINEGRAIEECLDLIASRESWPIERLKGILEEALGEELV
ncbi:MAG: HEAT repeat domain-containing protein, partial [Gammaproteobacteria bacterium]|nr:HEAT repeat domain-containing protein [Gammaproteobacteria bacterium]